MSVLRSKSNIAHQILPNPKRSVLCNWI